MTLGMQLVSTLETYPVVTHDEIDEPQLATGMDAEEYFSFHPAGERMLDGV